MQKNPREVLHMMMNGHLKSALVERAVVENRSLANLVETALYDFMKMEAGLRGKQKNAVRHNTSTKRENQLDR